MTKRLLAAFCAALALGAAALGATAIATPAKKPPKITAAVRPVVQDCLKAKRHKVRFHKRYSLKVLKEARTIVSRRADITNYYPGCLKAIRAEINRRTHKR